VAGGESGWVSRKVAALLSQILVREQEGGTDLTSRELEVLSLVVDGNTNNQIGLSSELVRKLSKSICTQFSGKWAWSLVWKQRFWQFRRAL
jgi:FixJ family two-component response regulator